MAAHIPLLFRAFATWAVEVPFISVRNWYALVECIVNLKKFLIFWMGKVMTKLWMNGGNGKRMMGRERNEDKIVHWKMRGKN